MVYVNEKYNQVNKTKGFPNVQVSFHHILSMPSKVIPAEPIHYLITHHLQ